MRKKVLITEAVSDVGLNFLRENGYELVIGTGPSEATLLKECPDCDGDCNSIDSKWEIYCTGI